VLHGGRGTVPGPGVRERVSFSEIRYEVEDGVATLTLHRPETLNALTRTMLAELHAALDLADGDDAVRALIVTGAGRAFCAGADLSAGAGTFGDGPGDPDAAAAHRDGGGTFTLRVFEMRKPVIAAINGPAVGFGVTMTLPMDVRLASTAARLGFVFARRGVVPEACSTWFLPRLVGIAQAAEWVYTGRVFSAEEALAGRLVSRVVAPEALLPAARALAREIAQHTSAVSVALSRQMLWRLLGADHPMAAHRLDSLGMYWTGRSADAHEGVAAFLDKRPPRFTLSATRDMPPFYPWWTGQPGGA
jgi:enoyl-CoA hydratase/carnithine racemase